MADITAARSGQSNSTTANINVNTSSGPQTVQLPYHRLLLAK